MVQCEPVLLVGFLKLSNLPVIISWSLYLADIGYACLDIWLKPKSVSGAALAENLRSEDLYIQC